MGVQLSAPHRTSPSRQAAGLLREFSPDSLPAATEEEWRAGWQANEEAFEELNAAAPGRRLPPGGTWPRSSNGTGRALIEIKVLPSHDRRPGSTILTR